MLINEIGVRDEDDVVELSRFREAPDPKARESMSTILAGALASEDAPPPAPDAVVVAIAPEPTAPGEVGNAA